MIIRFAGATGLAPEFLGTINNLTTSQVSHHLYPVIRLFLSLDGGLCENYNLTTSQVNPLIIAIHWFRVRSLDIGWLNLGCGTL